MTLMKSLLPLTLSLWLAAGLPGVAAADDRSGSKEGEAGERGATAEALRRRAEAAEERARAAEEAARNAAQEARAAREQAEAALETARRMSDRLRQIEEAMARMAGAEKPAAQNVAAAPPVSQPATQRTRPAGEVSSVSNQPVKVYGNLLFNANYVSGGTNNIDVPLFALPAASPPDQNHQNVNMTARQSRFGLRYERRIFDDARLSGVFEFDMFGGKPAFPNGQHFDLFRLRLAYGRIDWVEDSIEAGQDYAVFAPLNPTSLASFGIPALAGSGNLWIRAPQVRYEHREEIGEKSQFLFTTAVLDPNAGDNADNPAFRAVGLGERGSLPAFESRIGFVVPTAVHESSFGISGHYSRLLGVPGSPAGTTERSPIDSYGVAGDASVWLTTGMRLSGELFHGRALGVFSGGIVQSAVVRGGRARGINSTGGWLEMHFEAPIGYEGMWRDFSFNAGFGMENNRDEDLLPGLRKRNRTFMANGQYRFSPQLTFGLEYRLLRTDFFRGPARRNIHWLDAAFMFSF